MRHTLAPSALRGLLDATPGAVGCFDANLRTVYANTAFTMTTGVQAGRVLAGRREELGHIAGRPPSHARHGAMRPRGVHSIFPGLKLR